MLAKLVTSRFEIRNKQHTLRSVIARHLPTSLVMLTTYSLVTEEAEAY